MGPARIQELIPHRYPVLLVDRVLDLVVGERATTVKAVTANDPCLQWGAGDGLRAPEDAGQDGEYPLALVVESWCQSAALLAAAGAGPGALEGQVAVFGGMTGVEVHSAVAVGETLRNEVRITASSPGTWVFEGSSSADGRPVLTIDSVVTALRPGASMSGAPA